METVNKVVYYDGEKINDLVPAKDGTRLLDLPDTFFLEEAGFYKYQDEVWCVESEGLYEFISENGKTEKHYFFKNDIKKLIDLVSKQCAFSGEYKPYEDIRAYIIFNLKLVNEKEINTYKNLFLIFILLGLRIAHRHIGIYSPIVGNTIYNWLEIWDEENQKWLLYWVEKNAWLGCTNQTYTCFNVFDDIFAGKFEIVSNYKPEKIFNGIIEKAGYLEQVNQALFDDSKLKNILDLTKAFPVIRADGHNLLRIYSKQTYEENMRDTDLAINVGGIDYLSYKLQFIDEGYLKKNIYCKQFYVFSGKYVIVE